MSRTKPQTVLVTGAASGIGLSVAEAMAGRGGRLILVDRDEEALNHVAGNIGDAVKAHHAADVADEAFWDRIAGDLAGLDQAVINAGVAGAAPIVDLAYAEWRRILSVNLDGAFLTLRAAMRAMTADAGGRSESDDRSIVLVSSASGMKAEPGVAAYGASKAALIHLAKVAAKEGAPQRIRVNAIAPGGVETPVWNGVPFFADLVRERGSEAAAFESMAAMATPLGRFARPEEIAQQILFLLSPQAATITGVTLTSDGGYCL